MFWVFLFFHQINFKYSGIESGSSRRPVIQLHCKPGPNSLPFPSELKQGFLYHQCVNQSMLTNIADKLLFHEEW